MAEYKPKIWRCGACLYALDGLPIDAPCPECGSAQRVFWSENDWPKFKPRRRRVIECAVGLAFGLSILAGMLFGNPGFWPVAIAAALVFWVLGVYRQLVAFAVLQVAIAGCLLPLLMLASLASYVWQIVLGWLVIAVFNSAWFGIGLACRWLAWHFGGRERTRY